MTKCPKCQLEKEESEFYVSGTKHCKTCRSKYIKERRKNLPEMFRKYSKPEHYKPDRRREYYLRNKERISERIKAYRIKNSESVARRQEEYYQKNKNVIRERNKAYNKAWNSLPQNRIARTQRQRVRRAISGHVKFARTELLLGCSYETLRDYLSQKFLPGMTWDNYGEWHVDHIKPCASFDLSQENQQLECFNYQNLQPLWAKDNISKGAKFDPASTEIISVAA
jgi:hypothetical protein